MELRNKIVSKFGLDLPSTVVFDYPTINAITDYIISKKWKPEIDKSDRIFFTKRYSTDYPIAVRCVSCRYPGEANAHGGIAHMERRITLGDEHNTEIPYSRWDIDKFYSLENKGHSSIYTRSGSFLDESIFYFDRKIFHLSMQESVWIDPQIRLLLEEHAEIYYLMHSYIELESTGILVGCMFHEHMSSIENLTSMEPPPHAIVGNGSPYMAGRLSFNFGMNGENSMYYILTISQVINPKNDECRYIHLHRYSLFLISCSSSPIGQLPQTKRAKGCIRFWY